MFDFVGAWLMAAIAVASPVAHAPQMHDVAPAQHARASTEEPTDHRWACELPMVLAPSAAPGVKIADVIEEMQAPAAYLRSLGYDVTIGDPIRYERNASVSETIGQVKVVVARHAKEQQELSGVAGLALTNTSGRDALAGTLYINADPRVGELSSDVILHELGHVLGLGHKAHTVMTVSWDDHPIAFDNAQIAAIDCR